MSYLALYRKYRPKSFDEVRGQDHIVTTLKNQMITDRIGHAYLFCGTRGTGKTSVAKLFAKAVNCASPVNGSPCGDCPVCRSIDAQTSMNVTELDAASNNSVENIRQIRDAPRNRSIIVKELEGVVIIADKIIGDVESRLQILAVSG